MRAPTRCTTVPAIRAAVAEARAGGATIGFLPTMGALHEGHLAGVRALAARCDVVVVSIFVNPTQFDRADDLAAYPRDLDADEAALAALGDAAPDLVFAPAVTELYPDEPRTTVHVAGITEVLEGAARPGHFDGVATVVTKLHNIVRPDVVAFGRKDHQQLQVVRQLFHDLDVDVEVLEVPTVREADGVALSSRNQRLSPDERRAATALPLALAAAVVAARDARDEGQAPDPAALRGAATAVLDAAPVEVDYLAVVDPRTLAPLPGTDEGTRPDAPLPGTDAEARQPLVAGAGGTPVASSHAGGPTLVTVAVAASVGAVRLIDNVLVGDHDDEDRLLSAVGHLDVPGAPTADREG